MSPVHRWFVFVAAALVLAAPVSAQWKPVADAGPAAGQTTAAAPDSSPSSGIAPWTQETAVSAFTVPPLPGQTRTSRDVALMIVGGAALILGSVIGDDAGAMLAVGGGVVGLVGLYQYLT